MSEPPFVPPIQDPFPIPAVGMVHIARAHHQSIGLRCKTTEAESCAVLISSIVPGSLSAQTNPPLEPGQEILSINGIAVHSAKQTTDVIKSYADLELTIFDRSRYPAHPYTYVEVAPTSKINPGLSFSSCLDRSLVSVGEVFVKLEKTRLRTGDIVLAVNGVPVWKPEQADAEQLKAARNSKALVLYCVDLDKLCDQIASQAKVSNEKFAANRKVKIAKKARGFYALSEKHCLAKARINLQSTKLVEDETEALHQIKASTFGRAYDVNLSIRDSYKLFCRPAILSIKEMLNKQLGLIQAKVVQQAWAHSIKQDEVSIPTFVVPSAPVASVEITTAIGEGFDEDEFPLATAVALEDRNERFDV